MATLTEQMESLTADILSGHEERTALLEALSGGVKETLREFRTDRMRQLRADQDQREASMEALRGEVGDMLNDVRSDLEGARRAWQELAVRTGSRRSTARSSGVEGEPKGRPKSRVRRAKSK